MKKVDSQLKTFVRAYSIKSKSCFLFTREYENEPREVDSGGSVQPLK